MRLCGTITHLMHLTRPDLNCPRSRTIRVSSGFLLHAGLCLLLILSEGCGDQTLATGFLAGSVTISPLCPVEPCNVSSNQTAEVYAARKVLVYSSNRTAVIKELALDQAGRYGTELEEGTYIVDINHVGIDSSRDVPTTIHIERNRTITLNIAIDTGIR